MSKHPELKLLPNGKWEQIWDIVLKTPITKEIDLQELSQELSSADVFDKDYDCDLQIELTQGKCFEICVTLFRDDHPYHHDYSIIAIYKMFNKMEKMLGEIDTIQGQKVEDRFIMNDEMRERRQKKN
jgi:hypothetical protein